MEIAFLIAGMAVVTFAIRYSMIAILGRWDIPPLARRALRFVPIAAFAALIASELVARDRVSIVGLDVVRVMASGVAILVALITRNMLLTITVGMSALWIAQAILIR